MSFGSATLKLRYWSQVILETSIVTCAWPAVAARNAIRIIILIVLMTARFMIGLHRSVHDRIPMATRPQDRGRHHRRHGRERGRGGTLRAPPLSTRQRSCGVIYG